MAILLIPSVVLRLRGSVGHHLFEVDRTDGTYVGLVARGARRALFGVHVQDAVAEDRDRVRIRRMTVLDRAMLASAWGPTCRTPICPHSRRPDPTHSPARCGDHGRGEPRSRRFVAAHAE